MAAIAQTIAVVDKSGKVISTGKNLKNVWNEAKLAYLERKAEIKAEKRAKEEEQLQKARRAVEAMSVADDTSSKASRPHTVRQHSSRSREVNGRRPDYDRRPSLPARHHSSNTQHSRNASRGSSVSSRGSSHYTYTPLGQFNEDLQNSRSAPVSPIDRSRRQSRELTRRQTDLPFRPSSPRPPMRSYSTHDMENIDMDLAYGDFHPSSLGLALDPRVEEKIQKQELSSLVTKCKLLLDEANCAQHSVKAIVSRLQKDPDAMAAVALTLAEISNIVSKVGPGALAALKTGAPTVFAMLAAPEFLIAVGVGVGITVVMFGGYKIVKKIKARAAGEKEKEGSMDEMIDVDGLDRIEHWRRGIAESREVDENASVVSGTTATSVEGEYITPMAARSMGHLAPPTSSGRSKKTKSKKDKDGKEGKDEKKKKHRKKSMSEAGSGSSKASKIKDPSAKQLVKVKKPSPLRRMFKSGDTNSSTVS